ncbi:MAG: carboxypeptidase-like regulatory domain-containing protein, partial [Pirellulales bacterium]
MKTDADGYASCSRADADFTPAGGENHPLGDIVLPRADQELSGVLVDAEGEPVVGARVLAHSRLADQRYGARTETRLTDNQGRFQLRGLPRGDAIVWQSFDQFDSRKT